MSNDNNSLTPPEARRPAHIVYPKLQGVAIERLEWLERVAFLLYGERLYGSVDVVPNVFYVTTMFFHFWWIPVIPLRSFLKVLDAHGFARDGSLAVRLSLRSIALVWLRIALAASFIAAIIGTLAVVYFATDVLGAVVRGISMAVVAGFLWLLLRGLRRLELASPQRAEDLAVLAGFPPGAIRNLIENAAIVEANPDGPVADEVPCSNCGRLLSKRSRICPRCEQRQM